LPRPANPQVRSRLLSVGRDVVHDRGFNGCGVQDITTAAGVPKGSFYNYFESKEMFAAEILDDYWQSIEDRHGPILYDARIRPLARIAKFFRALTDDQPVTGTVERQRRGALETSGLARALARGACSLLARGAGAQ